MHICFEYQVRKVIHFIKLIYETHILIFIQEIAIIENKKQKCNKAALK
jgi:hypothetical protein